MDTVARKPIADMDAYRGFPARAHRRLRKRLDAYVQTYPQIFYESKVAKSKPRAVSVCWQGGFCVVIRGSICALQDGRQN